MAASRAVRDVVFVDGARTPFGKAGPKGMYAETRADDMVVAVIRELLRRHPELPPERVDEVAIAAATQIGDQGLTLGRVAGILAGLPRSVPGYSIDRMCAGAMTAVTTLAGGIAFGAYDIGIAGGVEHMGRHPMGEGADPNPRFLAEKLVDLSALSMGATAENLHDRFPQLTKARADAFAAASQAKLAKAYVDGKIEPDLVPVATRSAEQGWGLAVRDEPPRPGTTVDDLATLKTPFRPHGRITAGNAAGLNDGATACLLAAREVAHELGLSAKMTLVGYGFAGVDPEVMGVGPIPSTERALRATGLSIDDIGLFELNEAFAVQVLSFLDHFGLADDDPRVNQYGGAIAVGHPLASSGVRLMTQLARQFADHPEVRYGLTAMCVGLGQGGTVVWENPELERRGMSTPSLALPDEVVTRSLVRYLDVPGVPGEIALITLENGHDHTRPSTFGPGGLQSLDAALDAIDAHTPAVAAIAVTGKPFVFAVGADLSGVGQVRSLGDARAIAVLGHRVFRRLRDGRVPTFAFVNGAALGGGLELALHCRYRTLARSVSAIAFPEVFLGLVPGWGGTQLLPQLVGPAAAVQVIVENPLNQNTMLRAGQAVELGIADVLVDDADFLADSLRWAAQVLAGTISVRRRDVATDDWDAALARGRAVVAARLHGAAPAATRALDLIELARTAEFADGTGAEDGVLAELIMSDELRSGLYAFDLVQKRAKRPAGAPDRSLARPVTKVGIVGAGLMAGQLALLVARRLEVPVVLTDVDQARLDRGVGYVHGEIDKLQAKGRINADLANRLRAAVTGSLGKDAFTDADLVIEAVFEDLKVKQQVLAEVEEHVSPTAILATNTSSLSVTEMAADLAHPERVVGMHFFNPVAVMPLLEIVRAQRTDDATLATAFVVGARLNKSCVLVADAPAFVVNRLLTRFLGEVFATVDEGTPIEVADHALDPLGLPMSPMVLLALVGPAVALHTAETLHAAFPDRYRVSENSRRLVAAGKSGVYVWDGATPTVDPEVAELFEVGDAPSTPEQVRDRALGALADEVRRLLDEGVVAAPQDVDLCLILGAGWPFHLGGITAYLDRTGVAERVTGQRFLPIGVASVPSAD